MPKCLVIGGGLAGISSAVHLLQNKYKVTLLEASPQLGGRTRSFFSPEFGGQIDNGQHLILGCYSDTLELIKTLGCSDKVFFQENLEIPFVDLDGKISSLSEGILPYPFGIFSGLLKLNLFAFSERLGLIRRALKLAGYSGPDLPFGKWLEKNHAEQREVEFFWNMLVVGALNSSVERVSAKLVQSVFRTVFFNGGKSYKFVVPSSGLSEIFAEPAQNFISGNGGEIHTSEKISSIEIKNGMVKSVVSDKNTYTEFDAVICTLPHFALTKAGFWDDSLEGAEFVYSPIVTIHLLLREIPFKKPFYSLLGGSFDWLFVHDTHISLVKSAADELVKEESVNILQKALSELDKYFTIFHKDLFICYKVVKEKRATFVPSVEIEEKRSAICSDYKNFILAGDWTNTGLPATIEGAVRSGKTAAETVIQKTK